MPLYDVTLPVSGQVTVHNVEGKDEQDAIANAFTIDFGKEELEWTAHEEIVEGNVFCGMLNEAFAEKVEKPDGQEEGEEAGQEEAGEG